MTEITAGDRPCGRGEQTFSTLSAMCGWGPSPRVRGAGLRSRREDGRCGTIPARAGSSHPRERRDDRGVDHPRTCWEQHVLDAVGRAGAGTSPHARGAAGDLGPQVGRPGTIPARAGSRTPRCAARPGSGDHPCRCGEQRAIRWYGCTDSGPSLRARGAGGGRHGQEVPRGTIPTGAGSRRQDQEC